MIRTKSAHQFITFYMGTFRDFFKNTSNIMYHFNYYDEGVKGIGCYMEKEMDYTRLRSYFERYATTHRDPEIKVIAALMIRGGAHMTAEFHVTTKQKWLGFKDHFHIVVRVVNDETVGWGVRHLNMAFDC
ncbi:hypothetical protein L5515_003539 [Caenorhabditis briggsae]|nr:hypothetical protein L3Y34_000681 [Caenorhabditis briggsae]UMM22201.1 hypothetical protein L5515_003539 [Caenorhabditis briggsae]